MPSQPYPSHNSNISIRHRHAERSSWDVRWWRIRGDVELESVVNESVSTAFALTTKLRFFRSVRVGLKNRQREMYAGQFGAAITALWRAALLFGMLVS